MTATVDNKMPPGIPYIVANEFAERFCFYGLRAILAVYMTTTLLMPQAQATEWQHTFIAGVYFFPMLGAILADVFWGKYLTIIRYNLVYCVGCAVLALLPGREALAVGLFFIALGSGGIKPCVSVNVGDQFTAKNQHLIERAFSYFYFSINAGSLISIWFTPILLPMYGPKVAFGLPGALMLIATLVFWLGRNSYKSIPPAMPNGGAAGVVFTFVFLPVVFVAALVYLSSNLLFGFLTLAALLVAMVLLCLHTGLRQKVPPALSTWMEQAFEGEGLRIMGRLALIYLFVIFFWALWDQNSSTWVLQAQSSLMDKRIDLGFWSFEVLPSQIQAANAALILVLIPVFTFGIYPLMGRFFTVTPLRKIGIGLFVIASSFLIIAWIEDRIQSGYTVSVWWQLVAYVVLTAAEVMVSITALEFSYKQAPLTMKSFIMSLFLMSISLGNLFTAAVNEAMVKPLPAQSAEAGERTWVTLADVSNLVRGQKIDFTGDTGLQVVAPPAEGAAAPAHEALAGTYLIAEIDPATSRVRIMDVVNRRDVATEGRFKAEGEVSTYHLVGPNYFLFFAGVMAVVGVIFIFVAMAYREKTYVQA